MKTKNTTATILIIYTGGTIGMIRNRRTGALFLYKAVGRSRRRFLLPGTG